MYQIDWPVWLTATIFGWCCLNAYAFVQLFVWRFRPIRREANMTYRQRARAIDNFLYWGGWNIWSHLFLMAGMGIITISFLAVWLALNF